MIRHILFALLVVIFIAGCGDDSSNRLGSAQHTAVEAEARAKTTREEADKAAVDAAQKKAEAEVLAAAADKTPTKERIAAAADARVAAASAQAVSEALERVATKAETFAKTQAREAEAEHIKDVQAAADARWLFWCRAIALGCVLAGAIAGALIGYLARDLRMALIVGGGLFAVGLLVLGFGVALHWLSIAGVSLIVLGIAGALVYVITLRGKAHALLAAGYKRTADELAGFNPQLRRQLDKVSVEEQRLAGVLGINDRVIAAQTPAPAATVAA